MKAIELPVAFTDEEAMRAMKLPEEMLEEMLPMIERSREIARPKAAYARLAVQSVDEDGAVVGGIRLHSKVLAANLKDQPFTVGYVCTCGTELDALAKNNPDPMDAYFQYALNEFVLRLAIGALKETVEEEFSLRPAYAMNPGSLVDWPLSGQTALFGAIGDVTEGIGVELTDTFLMVPIKSVSGLYFTAEEEYVNCMLCPRETCDGRRAPYDPALYETRFASAMG